MNTLQTNTVTTETVGVWLMESVRNTVSKMGIIEMFEKQLEHERHTFNDREKAVHSVKELIYKLENGNFADGKLVDDLKEALKEWGNCSGCLI